MKRIDILTAILIAVCCVYWVVILLLPDITGPLITLYYWIQSLSLLVGYPGAFVVSFLGNVTILFPFPYIAVIFLLGGASSGINGLFYFDPWLLGIIAGIGATLGEMTGYLIGRIGSRFVSDEQQSRFLEFVTKYPRSTPIVLWFLAVTPLPDDIVVIPLGVAGYPFRKVIIPQLVGKCMFLIAIAWAGRLGLSIVESILISDPTSPITKSIEVVTVILIIIALYLAIRLDWLGVRQRIQSLSNKVPSLSSPEARQ